MSVKRVCVGECGARYIPICKILDSAVLVNFDGLLEGHVHDELTDPTE